MTKTPLYILPLLVILLLPSELYAKTSPTHENRTEYGHLKTMLGQEKFEQLYDEFSKGKLEDLHSKVSAGKNRIFVTIPKKATRSDRIEKNIRAVTYTATKNSCSAPARLLFLHTADGKKSLYAYEYLICDDSGLLSPGKIVDKYLARYGMYDRRDYENNLYIYDNVGRYRHVAIKPISIDGKSALRITVTDDRAYKNAYDSWKEKIGNAVSLIADKY